MTNNDCINGLWATQVACTAMQLMAQAVSAQVPHLGGPQQGPRLPSAALPHRDTFSRGGRHLHQFVGTQATLAPPAPQAGVSTGFARLSTGAVVIPDGQSCGDCEMNIDLTLAKVAAASAAGVRSVLFDIYADDREFSVDHDRERLAEIGQFVNVSTNEYDMQSIVLGLAKDDVTMFTPGRPELDGVPTVASQSVMTTLAKTFGNNAKVSLYLGGQPQNPNGSLNSEIANIYDGITRVIRGTGYQHKIIVAAPQDYGRNLSFYTGGGPGQALYPTNFDFMVTLQSRGNEEETNLWITQGFNLQKSFITGEQVSPELGIFNTQPEVIRQLALIASQGDASFLAPFSGDEVADCAGETPLLSGNLCNQTDEAVTLSPTGMTLLDAQQRSVLG